MLIKCRGGGLYNFQRKADGSWQVRTGHEPIGFDDTDWQDLCVAPEIELGEPVTLVFVERDTVVTDRVLEIQHG